MVDLAREAIAAAERSGVRRASAMSLVRLHFEDTRTGGVVIILVEVPETALRTMLFEAILFAWGVHGQAKDLRFFGGFNERHELLVDNLSLTLYTTHVQLRASEDPDSGPQSYRP